MRYYLSCSSIFDNIDRKYDIPLFVSAVKRGGGAYVRKSRAFGWNNQPCVVTWRGTLTINKKIDSELCKLPQFKKWGPIIHEKDW